MPLQDDDYELMPHNELEYLRKEVERLKRNPLGDTQASISLLDSLNRLNASVTKLNDVLSGASDEMVKAYNDASMQEQIRKMLEQQEKLARGIVAVAELVKEVQKKQQSVPDIDQLISQLKPAQPEPVQAPLPPPLPADAAAVANRNPFVDTPSGQEYQPILNQPLPHPGLPGAAPGPGISSSGPNAPGYMLHPGLTEPQRPPMPQAGQPGFGQPGQLPPLPQAAPNAQPGRINDLEIPLPPRRY